MCPEPVFSKKDKDKTKEELIEDLEKSRAAVDRLKKFIAEHKLQDTQDLTAKSGESGFHRELDVPTILDSMDLGILMVDERLVIRFANKKARDVFGQAAPPPCR